MREENSVRADDSMQAASCMQEENCVQEEKTMQADRCQRGQSKRVRLIVAYDGTEFHGWQKQPGRRTVEGTLFDALLALTGERTELIGASRTDSGVHAHGNVVVFDTASPIPAERFSYALNQKLPADVRVLASESCQPDWHPRHAHGVKTYVFRVWNERIEDPLWRRQAQHVHAPLSLAPMQAAAGFLCGTHDFRSFANPQSQVLLSGGDAVRTIYSIEIQASRNCHYEKNETAAARGGARGQMPGPQRGYHGLLTFQVTGSGFLYHMVRILVGTLLEVGAGRRTPESMKEVLAAEDRRKAGPTAEARGLELLEISYGDKG